MEKYFVGHQVFIFEYFTDVAVELVSIQGRKATVSVIMEKI